MKRYIFAILMCLICCEAYAQHIRDLSLSPTDSFKQPSSTTSPESYFQQFKQQNVLQNPPQSNTGYTTSTPPAVTNTGNAHPASFMEGFCDPNFKPVIASDAKLSGLNNCVQQQKSEICSQYSSLSSDVQQIIESAVSCKFSTTNSNAPDYGQQTPYGQPNYGQPGNDTNCSINDSNRLQMLKKYWNDRNTSYALVFMPDAVLSGAGNCIGGR